LKSLDEYIAANKGAFENPFRLNEKNIQDVIELVKQTEQMSERQGMKSKMLSDLFAKLAQAS
jgi:hypothetical protein